MTPADRPRRTLTYQWPLPRRARASKCVCVARSPRSIHEAISGSCSFSCQNTTKVSEARRPRQKRLERPLEAPGRVTRVLAAAQAGPGLRANYAKMKGFRVRSWNPGCNVGDRSHPELSRAVAERPRRQGAKSLEKCVFLQRARVRAQDSAGEGSSPRGTSGLGPPSAAHIAALAPRQPARSLKRRVGPVPPVGGRRSGRVPGRLAGSGAG